MDAEQLLTIARRLGADQAEVYATTSTTEGVEFEANRLKQVEFTQEEGIGLTVWLGEQTGISVAYGAVDPETLVQKALNAARVAPTTGVLFNRDRQYLLVPEPATDSPDLRAWGEELLAGIRTPLPQLIVQAGAERETSTLRLVNSAGLDGWFETTVYSASLGAEWVRGEDVLQVYSGDTVRSGRPDLARIIAECLQRVAWATETAHAPTGSYPVLFTERAVDLLWGPVVAALNGRLMQQKASPWTDRRGQLVLNPCLTLTQDPDQGPGALPFDDEGTATQRLDFVAQGVLQQVYTDLRTSRELEMTTTGNGFRGSLGSFATPDLVNLIVTSGDHSFDQLLKRLDRGLVVDQVLGNGAGLAGDFSVNVELGYWVEEGVIQGRVKDTMIAGNAFTLLAGDLLLGQPGQWQGELWVPALLVPGVQVSSDSE
ncbi:TldD/PmbA family protein [Candidatus Cyanaurora vandensis]|uniref:TldD/PmbA family protein n=1 Tax=Candidatus Cyanaurora vandensis TaxID=2714958 RepID=UPI00257C7B3F|nr:TldD/PmbA family protein [Candidatus Cyanaurora vandensis]